MNTPNDQTHAALQFEGTTFNVVERDGEPWLRGQQVADALGYQNHRQAIDDLYKRNASEFSADMTALVKLPDLRQQSADSGLHPQNGGAGQTRTVRVFSLRGAHLLGMFARTEKAKAFRRWVLDVLEATAKQQPAPTVEASELLHTLRLCRDAQAQVIALQGKEIERLERELAPTNRRAPVPYTDAEIDILTRLLAKGLTQNAIAREMNRSPGSVSKYVALVRVQP